MVPITESDNRGVILMHRRHGQVVEVGEMQHGVPKVGVYAVIM